MESRTSTSFHGLRREGGSGFNGRRGYGQALGQAFLPEHVAGGPGIRSRSLHSLK